MSDKFEITEIDGQKIVVGGIGRLFFEDGFPIHISVDILKDKGIKVSLLHIADELYKNGWSEKAIINTLSQDFPDCSDKIKAFLALAIEGKPFDMPPPTGRKFLYSKNGYDLQREMLYHELFGDKDKRVELEKILSA